MSQNDTLFAVLHVLNRRSLVEHWVVGREGSVCFEWLCNKRGRITRFKSEDAAKEAAAEANESEGPHQALCEPGKLVVGLSQRGVVAADIDQNVARAAARTNEEAAVIINRGLDSPKHDGETAGATGPHSPTVAEVQADRNGQPARTRASDGVRVRRTPNGRHPYYATKKGCGYYGWGDTPTAARAKLAEQIKLSRCDEKPMAWDEGA